MNNSEVKFAAHTFVVKAGPVDILSRLKVGGFLESPPGFPVSTKLARTRQGSSRSYGFSAGIKDGVTLARSTMV
jgi:hypothetical protein